MSFGKLRTSWEHRRIMKKANDIKDIKITLNLNQIVIILLVIASFLLGSVWSKLRSGGGESVKISQENQKTPTAAVQPTKPPFNPEKSNKPEVKFFVMSYCPYGNQAEAGMEPVYQLLKNKVDWQPRYVIYKDYCSRSTGSEKTTCEKNNCLKTGDEIYCSMHGVAELNQDIREICAFNLGDLNKWWQFVSGTNKNCNVGNIETCWTGEAKKAGLDTNKITGCLNREKFALAKKETAEMDKYQAFGSPAVFINGAAYNGGRSPEDYKKAICNAFETQPEECKTVLGQETAATAGGCN